MPLRGCLHCITSRKSDWARNLITYEGWAFRPRWDIDSSSSEYVIKDIETFGQLRDLIDNYYGDYCGMTHSVLGSLQR